MCLFQWYQICFLFKDTTCRVHPWGEGEAKTSGEGSRGQRHVRCTYSDQTRQPVPGPSCPGARSSKVALPLRPGVSACLGGRDITLPTSLCQLEARTPQRMWAETAVSLTLHPSISPQCSGGEFSSEPGRRGQHARDGEAQTHSEELQVDPRLDRQAHCQGPPPIASPLVLELKPGFPSGFPSSPVVK